MLDDAGNLDRRTRASRELLGMTPPVDELLADEIDGQLYAYRREWRCMVCSADEDIRKLIDTLLVYPKGYQEVLEIITPILESRDIPVPRRPTYKSIRNHQKRHLPFDKLAVREIVERRAKDRGISILEGKENILTAEAVLELIVQRGFESLVRRTQVPKVNEVIAAVTKLREFDDATSGSTTAEEALTQLHIVIEAVRRHADPEQWELIVADIRRAREATAIEAGPRQEAV